MDYNRETEGFKQGLKSGVADALIGAGHSDYAYHGVSVEVPGSYSHDYSRGYRVGFHQIVFHRIVGSF